MRSPASAAGPGAMLRGLEWGLALGVTALLAAWHLTSALRAGPLWRDEAHIVNWAGLPSLAEIWSNRHVDAFPATWPALVHLWISLVGGSDASLRWLGFLIGIATLAVIWWAGRALGSRTPAFTLVLFAASPCVLVFGGSVRGYGLALAALIFFLGAAGTLVARPSRKTIALAQVAALLAAQTHFASCIFVLAALVGAAAAAAGRRRWRLAATALGLGLLPAASLLAYLSTFPLVMERAVILQGDFGYAHLLDTFERALAAAGRPVEMVWWLVMLLAPAACLREILARREREAPAARDLAVFLLVTLVLAVPGTFVYLESLRLPTSPWYYLSMLAALALCADAALSLARRRSRREAGLLLALAIGAAALAAPAAWQTRGYRMTNLDRIAAHLGAAAAPEDLVVVTSYYLSASFDRYYRGPAPWTALPEVADFRFQGFLGVKAKMSREDPIRGELERIASTLRAGHRVWLVGSLRVPAPGSAPPIPPPAPTAESGWSDTPYLDAWSAQAGAVVQREARVVHRVLAPLAGAVNPLENIELLVARPFRSARPAE